jgi:hypothetical protein
MTFRVLAVAIVLSSGMASAAEDAATLEKMVEMNRKALDQLRVGQNQAARDGLLEAIVIGKRAGLSMHQMMARTYLHLGAVYLTGFGERDKAMKQFEAAVKIKPSIQITPAVLTPTVQEVFEAARAQVGGGETPAVAEAKPQPESAEKAEKAEAKSEPKAEKTEAKSESAEETKGEARPEPKLSVASETRVRGRRAKNRTTTHAAAEHAAAKPAEPDPSVEAAVSAALEEPEEAANGRDRAHPFWASLGVGSAVGFHGSRTLEATNDFVVPSGFSAAAAVAFTPEVGYRYSDRLAFSLQTRHQLIPVSGTVAGGTDTRHHFAHAIFARAHYRLYELRQKLELWGTGTVGGGSAIRLWVRANPDVGLPNSDTIAAGPVAFGPGVALVYHATRRVGIVGELRGLITVGGFAALADASIGASCSF